MVLKDPPVNAGHASDMGSTPRSRRSPGVGNGNPPEESGGLQSMGLQRVGHD